MKKLMFMTFGALAFGAVAQEMPVPAPVAVPPPIVAPSAVIAVPAAPAVLADVEPGALCKTYMIDFHNSKNGHIKIIPGVGTQMMYDAIMEGLEDAIPLDLAYDATSSQFDARKVARHKCNVAVWEGLLMSAKDGKYVFTIDSGYDYRVEVNDAYAYGVGQKTFAVNLKQGPNRFKIVRLIADSIDLNRKARPMGHDDKKKFMIDFRSANSVQPATPLLPSMLVHVAEEEGEW